MADEPNRTIRELHAQLEASGMKPGTAGFLKEERRRKVDMCKDQKGLDSCYDCSYFDHCTVLKAHLRDMYKVK